MRDRDARVAPARPTRPTLHAMPTFDTIHARPEATDSGAVSVAGARAA
jgi:hypothetical protein